jgi:hypothetical protein
MNLSHASALNASPSPSRLAVSLTFTPSAGAPCRPLHPRSQSRWLLRGGDGRKHLARVHQITNAP